MDRSIISLKTALIGFVVVGAVAFSTVTLVAVHDRLIDFQTTALERAVTVRAQGVALDLARTLAQDWNALQAVAETVDPDNLESITIAADVLVGDGQRVSWAGYAGLDALIAASSGSLLVGADISERLWFQRGLEGAFAGDARDALLLNRLIGGTDEEPVRFLDLSTPVRDAQDRVVGVIALHLNFNWTQAFLAETAAAMGIDLFLVSQNGTVIFASDGTEPGRLDLPSMRAARAGVEAAVQEVWPDGGVYLTIVVPQVRYGDLPSFGWRLVARISPDAFGDTGPTVTQWVVVLLALGIVVLLSFTAVFYRLFLSPLNRLARDATKLADGEDIPPFDTRSTREAAAISAALVRLHNHSDYPGPDRNESRRPRSSSSAPNRMV